MKPRFKPYLLCAALAMALLGALAGLNATASHGGAEAKPADKAEAPAGEGGEKGEGEKAAAAPVTYRLGPALKGYYDRSVLRSGRRVGAYRFPLAKLHRVIRQEEPWVVEMSCTLEFGSESGMAESEEEKVTVSNDILEELAGFQPRELLSVPGKIRLKEAMVAAVNRRLVTARVRQVYLTDLLLRR